MGCKVTFIKYILDKKDSTNYSCCGYSGTNRAINLCREKGCMSMNNLTVLRLSFTRKDLKLTYHPSYYN